ncbi:type I restriction enzyme, S subunit [Desulfatibacillum alkenivorans DSM 16219]|jgi:type I restriction enzyme S subunit|uniref:Type I restriction enzyme, S subunit n=1 Tax=Desulfatibacillum alkenivorans DSM 16219 TaxID=1121393 RepID=A0A1M6W5C9_9BACT|nr:restriction endonuclease subunit S [Desulfatibacillum alkenivorans]SHK88964.1 type I restriction enzyme, S subunit [Desulfatibacillum alkenivorans DSM 16219]
MQIKAIPSKWIENEGYRLDCGPYMSGAIEAREILKKLPTTPLQKLAEGHNGGIYNGPQFVRNYVQDPDHGVPFLTTSSMLYADLSNLPLLSKKDAHSSKLSYLEVKEGMTLISCSGSIGRTVYARKDMDGVWSNQDIMKVVANREEILPGYLYSFLCTRFGVPLVLSGTYGAIIQHIEPHHLANLPVPRLGEVEERAHELVQQAADLRTEANEIKAKAIELYENEGALSLAEEEKQNGSVFGAAAVSSRYLTGRMDAFFHCGFHSEVLVRLEKSDCEKICVKDFAINLFEPKRFKRVQSQDENDIPFFGTTALMWSDPVPSYFLYPRQKGVDDYTINERTVLIPRSGQISGIIGTATLPYGRLIGGAISEHAIRVECEKVIDAGYLFIALRSEIGMRQLKARAYGSSIPTLDTFQVGEVLLIDAGKQTRAAIGEMGLKTAQLRDQAIELENQARLIVEHAIEEGA